MAYGDEYKMEINKEDYFHLHHGHNYVEGDVREFLLHHHPYHEIYIYLGGKSNFLIESAVFELNPYDIILVPPYTLHQPQPYVGEIFERFVINVFPGFFEHLDCPEYQNVFYNMPYQKYKIPGHFVKRSDIFNLINFFLKYDKNSTNTAPLLSAKIVELLYHLNTVNNFEACVSINKVIQEIITYVDNNFKTIYTFKDVTDNFFYSENHLNHLFKKNTGITITQYINIKKMENVETLHNQGKSLTYACIESGFKSYDCFAYTYKKQFGVSPQKGLLNNVKTIKKL